MAQAQEQLLQHLATAMFGPGADASALEDLQMDENEISEMLELMQGKISPAEYLKQEEASLQEMLREQEELKAACLEMVQAVEEEQTKTRQLVNEHGQGRCGESPRRVTDDVMIRSILW